MKVKFLYDDPNDDSAEPVLVCCIDRDSEGNLVLVDPTNPSLGYVGTVEGTTTTVEGVTPIEVELGRLSVGRSPTRVLSAQLEEAISKIDDAASVKLDASGRIVLVAEDNTESTIDSPLENLALYLELINTGTIDGVTDEKLKDLGIVMDDALSDEYKLASSLFAAASDKTIPVTIDAIVYMNTILGIEGTLQGEDEDPKTTYVDYSDFTYDRSEFYDGVKVTILVPDDPTNPTSWTPTEVDVFEVVFKDADLSATGVEGFTQATDDARTVINYIHGYSVPVGPTTTN